MITVKLKGTDPNEIREQAKVVFGLVEPSEATQTLMPGDVVQTADGGKAEVIQTEVPAAPKATTRKPRATKEAPPSTVSEQTGEKPAFFDEKPEVVTVDADTAKNMLVDAPTLGDVRAALSEVMKTKSPNDVIAIIGEFKQADGKPCMKASQMVPADYQKLIERVARHLEAA